MRETNEKSVPDNNQKDMIRELGTITAETSSGLIQCLVIVGQIEGHKNLPCEYKTTRYEHVLPQLAAIEESPEITGLLVLINTVGGDVEAGLAIAEMIAGMRTPCVSLVLGGGHSIGVPLAVAARRSFIAPSAAMTIHPVRLSGVVIGLPETYNYFERIQDRIIRFITSNSRVREDVLRELMSRTGGVASEAGSVIYGEEAVNIGLIDQVGSLSDALAYLHEVIGDRQKEESPSSDSSCATQSST